MIKNYRIAFNEAFNQEKYQEFLGDIAKDFDYLPTFRIAETPFFISKELKNQLMEATDEVVNFIQNADFKKMTQRAVELNTHVPHEDEHTQFLAVDFGICEEEGKVIPKLIEVQGFPSVFNFQHHLHEKFLEHYPLLKGLTPYFGQLDKEAYLQKLRETILNGYEPSEVVLLEIEPEKQNTKIDFYYCARDLSIPYVCVTDLIKEGKKLFYKDHQGDQIQIKRIYNRVIFDELNTRSDLKLAFDFKEDLEVEWAGHPNWFFRISKYILPMLKGPYFIESTLLSDLESIPVDLENYVLKPLFSFSGSGVIFHVKPSDIEDVVEKDLYILQKKVNYIPILQAPDTKVKAEVRMLLVWPEKDEKPTLMTNLVRLSRGEMIGVKFNKDKDWVGGTIGLFESN
ncbi:hypothetical protein ACFOUP_15080 [Belliella kenyensis]|uniref:Circularly permuted type 2 ATP-grasp protein n=1 Tax=Belliella kenyensis TaxID=1472724 RepID=A0ABV8ENU0_9BACT|nr:hypothetical protein [Belliella kenyensis]MCH7402121.1 hypothetical protein [Belliella kenyensis]MDN3601563.1 hypothetical protein [Belliella kenyensis]